MKISTAINHKQRAARSINDIWRQAKVFHLTHERIIERTTVVFDSISHCPQWVISYVRGQNDLLLDLNYQNLEFCYKQNDILFSTSRNTDKRTTEEFYSTGRGSELSKLSGHHYYIHTDKRF